MSMRVEIQILNSDLLFRERYLFRYLILTYLLHNGYNGFRLKKKKIFHSFWIEFRKFRVISAIGIWIIIRYSDVVPMAYGNTGNRMYNNEGPQFHVPSLYSRFQHRLRGTLSDYHFHQNRGKLHPAEHANLNSFLDNKYLGQYGDPTTKSLHALHSHPHNPLWVFDATVSKHISMIHSENETNKYATRLLKMMQKMISFGFLNSVGQIARVVRILVRALDGRTDLLEKDQTVELAL
jgi:hypothetical protein